MKPRAEKLCAKFSRCGGLIRADFHENINTIFGPVISLVLKNKDKKNFLNNTPNQSNIDFREALSAKKS